MDHGKNFSGKDRIKLCAKSFVSQVYDLLARHTPDFCSNGLLAVHFVTSVVYDTVVLGGDKIIELRHSQSWILSKILALCSCSAIFLCNSSRLCWRDSRCSRAT